MRAGATSPPQGRTDLCSMDLGYSGELSQRAFRLRGEMFRDPTGLPQGLHVDPGELWSPHDLPGRSIHLEGRTANTEQGVDGTVLTLRAIPMSRRDSAFRRLIQGDPNPDDFRQRILVWNKAASAKLSSGNASSRGSGSYTYGVAATQLLAQRLGFEQLVALFAEDFPPPLVERLQALGYRYVETGEAEREGYQAVRFDPKNGKDPIYLRVMTCSVNDFHAAIARNTMHSVEWQKFRPSGLLPRCHF